ncbi:hypothetical protein PI95_008360 [Hassallia byssoidea VB512170]|uniref:Pentapeptide repeat-containing protein n=1 Tax=Hassallia byssoidea VB512170 TaxID=1304833 RepID=A0A846H7C3_9CYAN|nr:pentapeptide repeat-containing protein [Hassalia byssoidea]NEU72579.1 hypothetical protein [Hassalia byssoidea VB512170]
MPPDYSGQNLRGRSFKGQNLTGANFSRADIRGADFSNATIRGANFSYVKAGLQDHWTIGLIIFSLLLAVISGFFWSFAAGSLLPSINNTSETNNSSENNSDYNPLPQFIPLAILFYAIIRLGLVTTLGFLTVAVTVVLVAIAVMFGAIVTVLPVLKREGEFSWKYNSTEKFDSTQFQQWISSISIQAVISLCSLILAVLVGVTPGTLAVSVAEIVGGRLVVKGVVTAAVVVPAVFALFWDLFGKTQPQLDISYANPAIGAAIGLAFCVYVSKRALARDEKQAFIRNITIAITAWRGTKFYNADLTDADFTGATLKNTDLRKANLTRTRFYEAKKLDFARLDDTILTKLDILKLLVTGNGRGKSYAGANLKGANLIGADLKEANLKDAYISEATFQGACLEKANLTLTQAVNTDFTSAQMTGACVEAWNIESTTKLNNVDCRFVYLLEYPKPETDDRERRPSSGDFKPGEFTKLFEEVLNTVDLIFRDGIDWKAFVTAFKKVQAENEDTELAIQSIENKGDGVVVVKLDVPLDADKEKIHSDFTQSYQLALQAVEEKYKAQLKAKDEQIVIYRQQSGDMKEIISLLANKPINVQVDNKLENKNMTNSNDASRKINIGSVGGDFNASGQALNLGEISGTVTNTINELPKSDEPEKPGIKELLTQLQTAIEADTNLSEEDKAEALEQVKALAEAGKNPQEGAMQKAAKTAMKILKGTISGLPSAATLVEACGKLLPLISNFLGLG